MCGVTRFSCGGFSWCRPWTLGRTGWELQPLELRSCRSQALEQRLSSCVTGLAAPEARGALPWQGPPHLCLPCTSRYILLGHQGSPLLGNFNHNKKLQLQVPYTKTVCLYKSSEGFKTAGPCTQVLSANFQLLEFCLLVLSSKAV